MPLSLLEAAGYRERLKTLDLKKADDMKTYKKIRLEIMMANEGCKLSTYLLKGVKHIGIAFDLEREASRPEWYEALGAHAPDYDKVVTQRQHINKFQAEQLFQYCMQKIEKRLRHIYGWETWDRLKPHERLAMEYLSFEGQEDIVGLQSQFYKHLKKYTNQEAAYGNA
jgi:hypothetical protein